MREVLAREAALLRAEDEGDAAVAGELILNERRQLRQRNDRLLGLAMLERACANDERAIGYRFREGLRLFAFWRRSEAPTADFASRQCGSYGATTARRVKPKLAMARAAAPILRGLRGETRTM